MFTERDIFRNVRRLSLGFQQDVEVFGMTPRMASLRTSEAIAEDGTANPERWAERWDGIRIPTPHPNSGALHAELRLEINARRGYALV